MMGNGSLVENVYGGRVIFAGDQVREIGVVRLQRWRAGGLLFSV